MVTLGTHKGALQQTWPGHRFLLSNIDHGEDQTGPARGEQLQLTVLVLTTDSTMFLSGQKWVDGHSCNLEHTYKFAGCSNGRCVLTSCDELGFPAAIQYQLSYLTQNVEAGEL